MMYSLPEANIRLVVNENSQVVYKDPITCKEDAILAIGQYLAFSDRESVVALYLNSKAKPINWYKVSDGMLEASIVDVRQILKGALLSNAKAVILFHCHPSGDYMPSFDDMKVTKQVAAACRLLGITLFDHIIIGAYETKDYYSFKEAYPEMLEGGDLNAFK